MGPSARVHEGHLLGPSCTRVHVIHSSFVLTSMELRELSSSLSVSAEMSAISSALALSATPGVRLSSGTIAIPSSALQLEILFNNRFLHLYQRSGVLPPDLPALDWCSSQVSSI